MPARTGETVLVADANEKQQGAEETEQTRGFPEDRRRWQRGSPPSNFYGPS